MCSYAFAIFPFWSIDLAANFATKCLCDVLLDLSASQAFNLWLELPAPLATPSHAQSLRF